MNEQQYAAHWSALTGRPAGQVYIPEALRPGPVRVGSRVERLGLGGTVTVASPAHTVVVYDNDAVGRHLNKFVGHDRIVRVVTY